MKKNIKKNTGRYFNILHGKKVDLYFFVHKKYRAILESTFERSIKSINTFEVDKSFIDKTL